MIYADNAATTALDMNAFEAMRPYLLEEYGNPSQPYSFARSAKKALAAARETIANCIGALPEEIYFTSGGTEGNNWAIKGMMQYGDGRSIITTLLYIAMNLAFACSLRMGEILGLTWNNVHISDGEIAADNAHIYIDKELTRELEGYAWRGIRGS